ncbi:MAG: hypothetical protein H6713_25710 [Myxococcales bacterium]|nr:hypothetical protein [Myxococcales bacterium]
MERADEARGASLADVIHRYDADLVLQHVSARARGRVGLLALVRGPALEDRRLRRLRERARAERADISEVCSCGLR